MILPLTVQNLSFRVGTTIILNDIDFSLEHIGPSLIVGPNGAGKSVLLRLCHGLLRPTSGKILWATEERSRASFDQAMVFQRPILLRRSARANIEHALALRGVPRPDRRIRSMSVLEQTGIMQIATRSARVLSIGEQQLLALARAWSFRPRVLFLDEPTANLDPNYTRLVEEIILKINESGTKIIMTSHDMGQVQRLAKEVVFIYDGCLKEHQLAGDFFSNPKTEAAQYFINGKLVG
ncbi:MAG: ABC transporter ATP-binding protein [Acidiferrobacteraceae bacterium]|nr:ABC transporter ATP-binding protein [Acidiferrobacteraceae bacterium]